MGAPAGWYTDPSDPTIVRWWDGRQWTSAAAPVIQSRQSAPAPTAPPPRARSRRGLPVWAWVLIGAVALAVIVLLAPVVAPIALVVLITAAIGWRNGTRTWLRLKSRRAAISATAAAAAVLLVSGGVSTAALSQNNAPTSFTAATLESPESTTSDGAAVAPESVPTPAPTPSHTPTTTTTEVVETEAIAHGTKTVNDSSLAKGKTHVKTAGKDGVRELTYVVTLVDGKEVKRELVSKVVKVKPVTEVMAVGTKVAKKKEKKAASNCDPNYADACVPIASDVDCAWGSGNGPAYLDGTARVVGTDIYDLDRDGDGLACER